MYKDISTSIRYLKGIGPRRADILSGLGIGSIEDLLYYFPRRYEDRGSLTQIAKLKAGEYQTVKSRVLGQGGRSSFRRRGFIIFEATVEDLTGKLSCVWFNQPYLKQYFSPGKEVVLYGKVDLYGGRLQMQNPEYEFTDDEEKDEALSYDRIVPIYALSEKISQRMFRRIVKSCLDSYLPNLVDILPYGIRQRHGLLNIASAILNMHFPQDAKSQEAAYRRVFFEECFLLQLMLGLRRLKANKAVGMCHKIPSGFLNVFQEALSFRLTDSQKKSMVEVGTDMASSKPMYRLLQGDVGSGKTVVALYACMAAVCGGHQAAFMAPTEILAQQHYQNIEAYARRFDCGGRKAVVGLLTSSLSKKEKAALYAEVAKGKVDILIGTHALIQSGLRFKKLGFIAVDEQHKFGVYQRTDILAKGSNPDCLIMTATPIPRTLAMTIYADMDISTLSELPEGRLQVKTYLVDESKRGWVYDFLRENIASGRQAYIVYPIIDESTALDLKAARVMYEDLRKNIFKDFSVGLVHGRLKHDERNRVMRMFREGAVKILVSTVVIEVGVDMPNASVMVIEHAERFGLSQLHQLRGRIGRGRHESYCILIAGATGENSKARLEAIATESDGFEIAEKDLQIRGPGEFFGARQHGIPELRVNPLSNLELIKISKGEAQKLLEDDPQLKERQSQRLTCSLQKRFPDYDRLIFTG